MTLPYTQAFEFRDRYTECIIYYNKRPAYIVGASGDIPIFSFSYLPWTGRAGEIARCDDPLWTESPIHIGYLNYCKYINRDDRTVNTAHYLMRIPFRRSRQGLHHENILFPRGMGQLFSGLLTSKGGNDALSNNYPTLRDVISELRHQRDFKTFAFHKHYALEWTALEHFILYYKGEQVATGPDITALRLPEKYAYLKEAVQETIGYRVAT